MIFVLIKIPTFHNQSERANWSLYETVGIGNKEFLVLYTGWPVCEAPLYTYLAYGDSINLSPRGNRTLYLSILSHFS